MPGIIIACFAIIVLSQCEEEEIAPIQAEASSVDATPSTPAATGSFTISGIYTTYEVIENCSICTFIVPAGLTDIDGAELNLKAGAVICLDKAIQYGDLTFTNLEGTEKQPITIGTCGD